MLARVCWSIGATHSHLPGFDTRCLALPLNFSYLGAGAVESCTSFVMELSICSRAGTLRQVWRNCRTKKLQIRGCHASEITWLAAATTFVLRFVFPIFRSLSRWAMADCFPSPVPWANPGRPPS